MEFIPFQTINVKMFQFSMQDPKYCKILVRHKLTFIRLFQTHLLVKPVANTDSAKFLRVKK